MKLKKTLLQSMLVGISAVAVTSCGQFDNIDEITNPEKDVLSKLTGQEQGDGDTCDIDGNCAACGMG